MSRAREAEIHRELARLHAELADEIEGVVDDRPSSTRPRAERKPREIVRPVGEAPPHVRDLARRKLREKGFR